MTDNVLRAHRAAHVVEYYSSLFEHPLDRVDEFSSFAGDLIADLFHFFGPEQFMEIVELGAEHYVEEVLEAEEQAKGFDEPSSA